MSDPKNYTIGWICAIVTEYVAARAFLDEEHEGPQYVSKHDNNDYTLGKVGKHNVVIAVLPDGEYGTASAAGVAKDMLHSFPNIKIGLMVGIGGGVPSQRHDIRLGDIVVSSPRDGKGGVFQYDFGKTIQDQTFQQTGFLDQPPTVLRTAVNGLKAQYEDSGHRFEEAISSILEKKQRLQRKYKRPDTSSDRLYQASFTHPPDNEGSCAAVCSDDPLSLIIRPQRAEMEDNPAIHYGLIASGNQLMKNALVRDTLAEEKDVLCFEMEAAGLMNHFPCLVIRGICDYSDTHKNKGWQGYAAMTAAAYAKDLLYRIAPNRVEAEGKISDILSSGGDIQEATNAVKDLGFEQRREQIDRWLSPPDPSTNYNKALEKRQEGSGLWFLQSDAFAKWKTRRNSFLWLYGIPGCGKTILSSTIIENLNSTPSFEPLLYFYFDFSDTGKQTLENMIRSLIVQISCKYDDNWKQLESLFSSCEGGRGQPTRESLCKGFLRMTEHINEVWIVLDALDECHTKKGPPAEGLLLWMKELLNSEQRNVHLLVTSRPEQDITSGLSEFAHNDNMVPIQSDLIIADIRAYVRTRVREDKDFKRWRPRPDVQEEIETGLMEKADGMFRWAACQLDTLADCLDYDELKNALTSLPETLYETYDRIMHGIPSIYKEKAIRILQFLAFSERPLRIAEAVDAIVVKPTGVPYFDAKSRMPDPQEISRYCSSLVVVVSKKGHSYDEDDNNKDVELQLAHLSVKEYLTSNRLQKDIAQDFEEVAAKASIAKVCLTYLLHLDRELPRNTIRETFPLAQYSARYWMSHAAVAEGKDETLQGFIKKFLCHHRSSYRNCYNLYRPDDPWYNGSIDRGEEPASALYYASFGGLINTPDNEVRMKHRAARRQLTGHTGIGVGRPGGTGFGNKTGAFKESNGYVMKNENLAEKGWAKKEEKGSEQGEEY
ncbi:purine and uridine phosphorylase [Zopfia rhizophila CBS 207.26]|uniref:Purine and uridine phosphorylase n=1 Tax=Zopfia rhizophila CBS 207.26 TaxID=1314779 RepID=A0A6A6DP81_9PEZI|nr:purine and uridine phosphorylase [Zopfia rhizophila CBS 207.26]